MPPITLTGLQATVDGLDQRLDGLVESKNRIHENIDDLRKDLQDLQNQIHDIKLMVAEDGVKHDQIHQFRRGVGQIIRRVSKIEKKLAQVELREAVTKPWLNLWVKFLVGILIFVTGLVANWLVTHMLR